MGLGGKDFEGRGRWPESKTSYTLDLSTGTGIMWLRYAHLKVMEKSVEKVATGEISVDQAVLQATRGMYYRLQEALNALNEVRNFVDSVQTGKPNDILMLDKIGQVRSTLSLLHQMNREVLNSKKQE